MKNRISPVEQVNETEQEVIVRQKTVSEQAAAATEAAARTSRVASPEERKKAIELRKLALDERKIALDERKIALDERKIALEERKAEAYRSPLTDIGDSDADSEAATVTGRTLSLRSPTKDSDSVLRIIFAEPNTEQWAD